MKDLQKLKEQYALLGKEIEKLESESKLPMSWEKISDEKKPKYFITDGKVLDAIGDSGIDVENLPTHELAEAVMYRNMLITLVHIWNDGEQLNWSDSYTNKYVIGLEGNKYFKDYYTKTKYILAFKTEELRDKFFDNPIFQEYMEKAKLAM